MNGNVPEDQDLLVTAFGPDWRPATEPNPHAKQFEQFYLDTHVRLFQSVMVWTQHRETAQDIVSGAYERALTAWPPPSLEADPDSNPYGWLATIAWRTAQDYWAKSSTKKEVPIDETDYGVADERSDPLVHALARDTHDQLAALLNRLSPDLRAMVVLHHLNGMTYSQVAAHLKLTTGQVKQKTETAMRELRRMHAKTLFLSSPAATRRRSNERL